MKTIFTTILVAISLSGMAQNYVRASFTSEYAETKFEQFLAQDSLMGKLCVDITFEDTRILIYQSAIDSTVDLVVSTPIYEMGEDSWTIARHKVRLHKFEGWNNVLDFIFDQILTD